jgi:hypothetical protein
MLRRLCMAVILGSLMAAVLVPAAAAEPSHPSKNAFPITVRCDNGQIIDLVITGQIGRGERFAPAHVVGSTAVFQPLIIDEIIEITPPGGTTETIVFQATKPNLQGNLPAEMVTCSYDDTKTFPDAVIHVVGFTTGVFTPKS